MGLTADSAQYVKGYVLNTALWHPPSEMVRGAKAGTRVNGEIPLV